jgi:hypothetical protein
MEARRIAFNHLMVADHVLFLAADPDIDALFFDYLTDFFDIHLNQPSHPRINCQTYYAELKLCG